ncbi:hypothetical protein [Cysteiniphilum sp. QT6929]|uniref:hypothetical protein n=1 Tax=Cysteiniphilum sp. QT6929 TaxID=2975055 RepID=UPI0024B398ED|nr:hypothetical protein [Cysteiniphilum sp. QT6929]WHN65526.1 hypothetical protein NYP54_10900 [Cysteiniphilum sp. QT6929]
MRFINPYALIYNLKNHKHMVNEVCINNDYQNICCLSDTCHVNQELKKIPGLDQSIAVELEQLLDKYYSYRITQCSWERFINPQEDAKEYFKLVNERYEKYVIPLQKRFVDPQDDAKEDCKLVNELYINHMMFHICRKKCLIFVENIEQLIIKKYRKI